MSGTASTTQLNTSKSTTPISLLPTDVARILTHVHPVLLLSTYYLRFNAIVADPVSTLITSLAPLIVLQTAYSLLCLPIAPASPRETSAKKTPSKKGKQSSAGKKAAEPTTGLNSTSIVHAILSLTLTLLASPLLTTLQILLGAPLTTHLPETLLSSAHLSLLALFPLFYTRGLDKNAWFEIVSAHAPLDEVFGAAVGAAVGAWLGAVPIPLDWDRDWQRWPVTVVTGMYIGWAVGKEIGGSLVKGRRIEFEKLND